MTSKILLATVVLLTFFASCTKTSNPKLSLTGSWKLIEEYDGYLMGGSFTWIKVDSSHSTIFTFSANGDFSSIEAGSNKVCTGTYSLVGSNTVNINTSCQQDVVKYTITETTQNTIIFDCAVREGVIRYKYAR